MDNRTEVRDFDSPAFDSPGRPVNLARFVFLDPQARLLHPNWSDSANTSVSILCTEAGRNPYDKGLTDLVGELSTRSEEFRTRWAAHNVRLHRLQGQVVRQGAGQQFHRRVAAGAQRRRGQHEVQQSGPYRSEGQPDRAGHHELWHGD
jgi:hypothetical protein